MFALIVAFLSTTSSVNAAPVMTLKPTVIVSAPVKKETPKQVQCITRELIQGSGTVRICDSAR